MEHAERPNIFTVRRPKPLITHGGAIPVPFLRKPDTDFSKMKEAKTESKNRKQKQKAKTHTVLTYHMLR